MGRLALNNKRVGKFQGAIHDPGLPVKGLGCTIKDRHNGEIIFLHKDIADLEYLIGCMKKEARAMLPDSKKNEI